MSVSGISSTTDLSQAMSPQGKFQKLKNSLLLLGQALQSGSLSVAEQAFATLKQMMPNMAAVSQNDQNPLIADLNAVGKAVQSGDLSTAKSAFAKLQLDVQKVRKANYRHLQTTGSFQDVISSLKSGPSQTNGSTNVPQSIGTNLI